MYPVTAIIIVINIIMVLFLEWKGSAAQTATLFEYGAMYHFNGYADPEPWRYLTAIFLHGGWSHLLFNCFALYVFAPPLERILGTGRYVLFYLVSGVAGNMNGLLFRHDDYVSVGASGAIYGIYAAYLYLALFRKEWMDPQLGKTMLTIVGIGVIYSVVVPNVDLWAHLGGFVGGFLCMGLIVLLHRK